MPIGSLHPVAWLGVLVSLAIILMNVLPEVPGSFSGSEWLTFALWSGVGLFFWIGRPRSSAAGSSG